MNETVCPQRRKKVYTFPDHMFTCTLQGDLDFFLITYTTEQKITTILKTSFLMIEKILCLDNMINYLINKYFVTLKTKTDKKSL